MSESHANSVMTAAPANSSATMNNGNKDTSNTDVQKLQEQLNDIKEQVSAAVLLTSFQEMSSLSLTLILFRPCAPCAWTG